MSRTPHHSADAESHPISLQRPAQQKPRPLRKKTSEKLGILRQRLSVVTFLEKKKGTEEETGARITVKGGV